MRIWTFPVLFLLTLQVLLLGQTAPSPQEKGRDALASGLWELAEMHFRTCLLEPGLTDFAKAEVSFQLVEALIRGGKSTDALELLNLSHLASHPAQDFWRAQALASEGKLTEAIEGFSKLLNTPQAPYRTETVFSLANLLLATQQPERTLEALRLLNEDASSQTDSLSKLMQTEILADLGRTADARATLPAKESTSESNEAYRTLLEAQLLLQEGSPEKSADLFKELIAQPMGQSLPRYESAALGLADSLAARLELAAASQSLLAYIQDHPQSRQLAAMFERLRRWLPEQPAVSDPVLETLAQWISPPELPALGAIAASAPDFPSASTSAFPSPFSTDERLAHALYTRATGLHRLGTADAKAEARRLMTRLRLENPDHPLVNPSLYQLAAWYLAEGKKEAAFSLLEMLRDASHSPASIKGEAAFLEAGTAYNSNDLKQASQLFEEAASSLTKEAATAARFNASISKLRQSDLKGYQLIFDQALATDPELATNLELEQALSTPDPTAQKAAIEKFLAIHPDHPRAAEARLALVEAALGIPTPDLPFARTQLEEWAANPELFKTLPPVKLDLIRLRIADLSKDSAATLQLATKILTDYPTDPSLPGVTLTLGRTLFEAKDYNQARLTLEKLANADTDPQRAQAAWLLAARSAALVGTASSKEEAIVLFDRAIGMEGPLVSIASLEKADHLIANLGRTQEASTFLEKWFDSLPTDDNLRLPAGLLLGQALYAQGADDQNSLEKALEVYDALLPFADSYPALIHRLQYLRGLVLERLPDPKDPGKKRENQAFIAYYSVLETKQAPPEWEYFELCGFKALSLLEKSARWAAAIATAEKIASFKGPRSQEAATRANQIQLTHHIWEDIPNTPEN